MELTSEQSDRIEAIYLEMYELLLLYGRKILSDPSLAEEAIQETFRIACTKPEALLSSPNPKGWVITTLKHTIQNINRAGNSSHLLLKQYIALQGDGAGYAEDRLSLDVAYGNLARSEEFQLIREMAVEGRSHLEMAEARGISVAACKKRVQRAKEFLRRKI